MVGCIRHDRDMCSVTVLALVGMDSINGLTCPRNGHVAMLHWLQGCRIWWNGRQVG
jgi:hypothetical protein